MGTLRQGFLMLSAGTVWGIALLYGVNPNWFAGSFLAIDTLPTDGAHILRAVMGLYIAIGSFWVYGALNPAWRNPALVVFMLFCGGLVAGRLLSVALDGVPSLILNVYILMEVSLIPVAWWLLRQPD